MVVSDYSQMDRVLKEERDYILNLCKKIKKAGCNVLLVQKSILRFAKIVAPRIEPYILVFSARPCLILPCTSWPS